MKKTRIRVLVGKPGLDGHDRGAKVIARALRDAGMEVINSGLHQTPEQLMEAAIQEDVDLIGISVLSGAHMTIFPRIKELLKEQNAEDILLMGGGSPLLPFWLCQAESLDKALLVSLYRRALKSTNMGILKVSK